MVGDLLISGTESAKGTNLPTVGDIEAIFPKGSGFVPTGLRQKLYVINRHLAIGWAGDFIAARVALKELKQDSNPDKLYAEKELAKIFNSLQLDSLSVVGVAYDGVGMYTFGYNCQGFPTKKFGSVRVAGSGTQDFHNLVNEMDDMPLTSEFKGNLNPLETSVTTTLILLSQLSGNETTTGGKNLLYYYGAGYELISLVKGAFTKITDITHITFKAIVMEDGNCLVSLPKQITKHFYQSGALLIRKALLSEKKASGTNAQFIEEQAIYVIEPISGRSNINKLSQINIPEYHSRFTCSHVVVELPNGNFEQLNMVHYEPIGDPPVKFEEDGQQFKVHIKKEFTKTIAKAAIERSKSCSEPIS